VDYRIKFVTNELRRLKIARDLLNKIEEK
jgi:hypothetical protein